MSLLEVKNLRIDYRTPEGRRIAAVDGVEFRLEAGRTLGIVGESGCGKSTLARALLGHLRPGSMLASGAVMLDGEDLFSVSPQRLRELRGRRVALVPQQPLSALTPHLRTGDQVSEVIRAHRDVTMAAARKEVEAQFDRTRLPHPAVIARRFPHQISGGQRQRVAIAAALSGVPGLLVLDEPTTALDKTTEIEVLALVQELQAKLGAALVYVSHDLGVIRAMCAHVLVMKAGVVVEEGPTEAVFRHPRTDYARELVSAMPQIAGALPRPRTEANGNREVLLSVQGVTFRYGGRAVLRRDDSTPAAVSRLSFDVHRGESFGLVGESGSGKSTIAGLISGLVSGAEGRIVFRGLELKGLARRRPTEINRQIQLVFQDPLSSLNPAQTVESIICRPMELFLGLPRAKAREQARRLLAELELDPALLSRRPTELSGGQQQRVALARAFAADPELIICDEVTSALDVTVQSQVVKLLQKLQRDRKVSFVFISHDLGFIDQVADRVLVLRQGTTCEMGHTDAVFSAPRHAYTQALVAAYSGKFAPVLEPTEA